MSAPANGKVVTVRGEVEPEALGAVLMHEHLHADMYDWAAGRFIAEERPAIIAGITRRSTGTEQLGGFFQQVCL